MQLQKYSALDALVFRKLGNKLKPKHQNNTNDALFALKLEIGDQMNCMI